MSLTGEIMQGAPARLNVPGLPATDGVVEFLSERYFVGARTPHGIHSLIRATGTCSSSRTGFSEEEDEDEKGIESPWRSWLGSAAVTPA